MSDPEMVRIILAMQAEIGALKRQVNAVRFGTVHKVDTGAATAQMLLSDANGREFLSPMRPWAELAGAEKSWRPVSEGQQVMMVAPHGDMRQGVILPMTFSDAERAPSSDGSTRILSQFGGGHLLFDGGGDRAELAASRVDLGGGGGKRVARIGDKVHVQHGSSAGLHPIVEGSETVFAVD